MVGVRKTEFRHRKGLIMQIHVYDTKEICAKFAAERGAEILRKATSSKQSVRAVFASAASQIEFLQHLTSAPGIDWKRVELFHLDEYIGISEDHPASFRRFLKERVIGVVPIGKVNFINGSAPDAEAECKRIGALLDAAPIDVGFIGIRIAGVSDTGIGISAVDQNTAGQAGAIHKIDRTQKGVAFYQIGRINARNGGGDIRQNKRQVRRVGLLQTAMNAGSAKTFGRSNGRC
jgi:hypothetical protein